MSFTTTPVIGELRQRMIEDMNGRKLGRHCQRGYIASCKRFAGYLKRSPDTATADDVRLFQLHLIESGASVGNRATTRRLATVRDHAARAATADELN